MENSTRGGNLKCGKYGHMSTDPNCLKKKKEMESYIKKEKKSNIEESHFMRNVKHL